MYISSWPGLTPRDLFAAPASRTLPYPLNASHRSSFCVARSGIYHLFRALQLKPGETVLAPDYYSGNEIAAIQAAGASVVHYPILRNLEPDLEALARLAKQFSPRVIYVIHYLGWPQPMQEIQALCTAMAASWSKIVRSPCSARKMAAVWALRAIIPFFACTKHFPFRMEDC